MSYSPRTGLVYIPGDDNTGAYRHNPDYKRTPGRMGTGTRRATPDPPRGTRYFGGFLVAWDPVTQQARWRVTGDDVGGAHGGTLATAGDLVFHHHAAYHAVTGEKLWDSGYGDYPAGWISYMLDGKQYVAVLADQWPDNALFVYALDGGQSVPFRIRPLLNWMESAAPYLGACALLAALVAGALYFRRKRRHSAAL